MAAGCERMVHPIGQGCTSVGSQRRFIGVMLAAPFFVAGGAVTLVTAGMGAAVTMAAIFAAFGLCWFAALLVAASGSMRWAGPVALACGKCFGAGLHCRRGRPCLAGRLACCGAAVRSLLDRSFAKDCSVGCASPRWARSCCSCLPAAFFLSGTEIAAWHWLLPLAWALTLVPRLQRVPRPCRRDRCFGRSTGLRI